jgi:hypothetical protein
MNDWPTPIKIIHLRADIAKLADSLNMLRHSELDATSTQVLLSRKRAELEYLIYGAGMNVSTHHSNSVVGRRPQSAGKSP